MTDLVHPISSPSGVDSPVFDLAVVMEDGDGDVGNSFRRRSAIVIILTRTDARGRIPPRWFDGLRFNGDLWEDPIHQA